MAYIFLMFGGDTIESFNRHIYAVILTALLCFVFSSQASSANDTPAGTEVAITFSLDYTVNGAAQNIDTSAAGSNTPTVFTVDRRIDLTVTSLGDLTAPSAGIDQDLIFSVTNDGNDVQAYSLSVVDEGGDDATVISPTLYYYVDDGDLAFEPDADDGAIILYNGTKTPDLAADARLWVVIRSEIPTGLAEGDAAIVTLVADTLEPSSEGTAATPVEADTDGNTISGPAENVLADGSGTANENENEGDHSASGTYNIYLPLVVRNTNDSGQGSLRDAIEFANAYPDEDQITFEIPGVGPHTIAVTTGLPAITDNGISIDGTTQSGAACGTLTSDIPHTLMIEITNNGAAVGFFLELNSENIVIKGLSLYNIDGRVLHSGNAGSFNLSCSQIGLRADNVTPGPVGGSGTLNAIVVGNSSTFSIENTLIANSRNSGINSIGSGQIKSSIIRNNNDKGIRLGNNTSVAIISNHIYSNGNLGIDFNNDGVTLNDAPDDDTGPNDLLNFPVLNVITTNGTTALGYDFNLDVPSHAEGYRIEFFANSVTDPLGHGEGEIYLGHLDVDHTGGNTRFFGTLTANQNVAEGTIISATTTRKTETSWDITSEFALNVTSVSPAELTAVKNTAVFDPTAAGLYAVPGNDIIYSFILTNTGDAATDPDEIVLIDSISAETTFYNGDIDGDGTEVNPVSFSQSAGAGLTFDFATDTAFSDDPTLPADFAACDYTPIAGYDPAVTFICLNPKGALAAGNPDPNVTLSYRVRID